MTGMDRSNRSERAWAKWRGLVEEQRASGLSVHRFCQARGIPASSLFAWRRKLRGERTRAQTGPAMGLAASSPERGTGRRAFVEAVLRGDPGAARGGSGVMVELGRGRRIVLERGFDRRVLLEVIAALEGLDGEPAANSARDGCS
jgi:hypothetical protein